jgi:hypothetical protein
MIYDARLTIKMDRPIDKNKHILGIGGFEVIAGGKNYQFDFNESSGSADVYNPKLIRWTVRNPDISSFPDMVELENHIHEITEFVEVYVYTGEDGDPEIHPVSVEEFRIITFGEGKRTEEFPKSTEFVEVIPVIEKDVWFIEYKMKDTLLKAIHYDETPVKPHRKVDDIS